MFLKPDTMDFKSIKPLSLYFPITIVIGVFLEAISHWMAGKIL